MDYNGIMGVPITFLDKYNPEQFEIIGMDRYVEDNPKYGHRFTIEGKETYARILIRRRERVGGVVETFHETSLQTGQDTPYEQPEPTLHMAAEAPEAYQTNK